MRRTTGIVAALICAAVLGAASTIGDWVWANYLTDGAVVPGVVHGLLFFVLLALVLAPTQASAGTLRKLLLALPAMGVLIAAGFYPVAMVVGYLGGLMVAWIAMWVGLALALRRAAGARATLRSTVLRGVLAATLSGVAFWLVSGIWTDPDAYADPLSRFGAWTFAFLPGLAALLVRTVDKPASQS